MKIVDLLEAQIKSPEAVDFFMGVLDRKFSPHVDKTTFLYDKAKLRRSIIFYVSLENITGDEFGMQALVTYDAVSSKANTWEIEFHYEVLPNWLTSVVPSKFVAKRFSSERDVVKELATVFDVIKKHKT